MKPITKNLVLSAMFLAIGLILPLFTAQIPQIGQMLLPMHIPVLLCMRLAERRPCGLCAAPSAVGHIRYAGVLPRGHGDGL